MTNTDLLIKRALASVIDSIILGIIFFVIMFLLAVLGIGAASVTDSGGVMALIMGLGVLLMAVIMLFYYMLLEGPLGRGQTIGKKIIKIKVIHEDGNIPSYTQAAIRTVLRIVDGMFFYIIGVVVIYITEKDQRVGDIAAKTIVVDA